MSEKILIVDDDLDTLKLVGLMLQRQGYAITAASTGGQALRKASIEIPNLILLDVMMPDMDGYEVTRQLRSDPQLSHIPIIMFTAKTMVDDKVAGFEAGVDDYMTKPTHPAELTSRVKALLARSSNNTSALPTQKGDIIGVMGTSGGVGTTTVALNLAASIAEQDVEVIACDLRPGHGSLGLQLGIKRSTGVSELLALPVGQIKPDAIRKQLKLHKTGLKALLSSYDPQDSDLLTKSPKQVEALVMGLASMCEYLVLDLGAGLTEANSRIVSRCDQLVLLLEPTRVSVELTKPLLEEIEEIGISRSRVAIIMLNRVHSTMLLSRSQIERELGTDLAGLIPPSPELAYQAIDAGRPMISVQPGNLFSQQIKQLSRRFVKAH